MERGPPHLPASFLGAFLLSRLRAFRKLHPLCNLIQKSVSTRTHHHAMVSSIYEVKLAGISRLATISWVKNLTGQGLSINVNDRSCDCAFTVGMNPLFFWKKRGCKSFEVGGNKVDVFYDLSSARYGSGPEPLEGYFVAVVSDQELVLLLGDMCREAYRKTVARPPSTHTFLISRREHISGKSLYSTKAQFGETGKLHAIDIEYQSGASQEPCLCVRIDRQMVVLVKRLMWKFRGNQTIFVDGVPVELFWDVHNWLFNPSDCHAVFMFQTGLCSDRAWSGDASCASLFQFHQSDDELRDFEGPCFSLLLFAWKSE